MTKTRRRLLIASGLLLSAFFLWFALKDTNFEKLRASLAKASLWYMAPLLLAYGLYYWVKAVRWRVLLRPMTETSAREIFSPMMIGFMGNNLLPAHLGEFVRMYLAARQLGLRNTQVLATIVLERMFDFLSVVFFLGVVLIVGKNVPATLVTIGYVTALVALAFMAIAAVYVTWTGAFLHGLAKATFFVPFQLRRAILQQLEIGALGLHAIKQPRLLAAVVATSVLQWACMGVSTYMALLAVKIDVRMSAAFVVLAATTFGVTLPAAPGFLGTVQAAFWAALQPYGQTQADAFAASAFFHVPTYLAVTLLGVWLLRRSGMRLRQIQAEAAAAEAAEAGR